MLRPKCSGKTQWLVPFAHVRKNARSGLAGRRAPKNEGAPLRWKYCFLLRSVRPLGSHLFFRRGALTRAFTFVLASPVFESPVILSPGLLVPRSLGLRSLGHPSSGAWVQRSTGYVLVFWWLQRTVVNFISFNLILLTFVLLAVTGVQGWVNSVYV